MVYTGKRKYIKKSFIFVLFILLIEQYTHRCEDKKFLESGMIKALVRYRETDDLKQAVHGILEYLGDFYKAEQGMLFLHNEAEDKWESLDKWQDIRINSASYREMVYRGLDR